MCKKLKYIKYVKILTCFRLKCSLQLFFLTKTYLNKLYLAYVPLTASVHYELPYNPNEWKLKMEQINRIVWCIFWFLQQQQQQKRRKWLKWAKLWKREKIYLNVYFYIIFYLLFFVISKIWCFSECLQAIYSEYTSISNYRMQKIHMLKDAHGIANWRRNRQKKTNTDMAKNFFSSLKSAYMFVEEISICSFFLINGFEIKSIELKHFFNEKHEIHRTVKLITSKS